MSIEWEGKAFPPVGEEIKFWDDHSQKYRKGTVVYSGQKGATVDVGCLMTSGETGDFSALTAEDRAEELAVAAIWSESEIRARDGGKVAAQKIYRAIKAGKIPGVKLE